MQLSQEERRNVEVQRPRLAAMQTSDARVKQAVDESFVHGYREVIWISVVLAVLSGASGRLIGEKRSVDGRQ
jgi:hypothetical protein